MSEPETPSTTNTPNETSDETWAETTTAFDRIRTVAETATNPRSIDWFATQAQVEPEEARTYLTSLVEMAVLERVERDGDPNYVVDPMYIRHKTLRILIKTYDRDELRVIEAELHAKLNELRDDYNAPDVDHLRERAETKVDTERYAELKKTVSEWNHLKARRASVNDALDNYESYHRNWSNRPD